MSVEVSDESYQAAYKTSIERAQETQKDVIEDYRNRFSKLLSRERAVIEADLWMSMDPGLRVTINSRDGSSAKWLYTLLQNGEPSFMGIRARSQALNQERSGYDVSLAWGYLDNPENQARHVRQALTTANSKVEVLRQHHLKTGNLIDADVQRILHSTFKEALLDFFTSPDKQRLENEARSAKLAAKGNGKPSVRASKPPTEKVSDAPEKTDAAPEPETGEEVSADSLPTDRDGGHEAKDLWSTVQEFVHEHVGHFAHKRLDGIESNVLIDERLNVLHREMHACFQDFLLGVRQARIRSKDVLDVRREQLRWALEVLRIDPPRRNWRKEHIDKQAVKKQHRLLSARFHPDTHQGDTRYVSRYGDVQEAYQLLKSALNL
jgi:hypothetical protein